MGARDALLLPLPPPPPQPGGQVGAGAQVPPPRSEQPPAACPRTLHGSPGCPLCLPPAAWQGGTRHETAQGSPSRRSTSAPLGANEETKAEEK